MAKSCASPMEQLIRRFAGAFVLGSLALGWWVHPGWFFMTAFVGVNLFQSSFTRLCPLENILQALGRGKSGSRSGARTEPVTEKA